ncbi:MAG: Holliday junction branch migration protein RuvA [candidate division WOR-3 bacterium]|nr:Holliday junction branch migration protein RuvA [candidate division WOR-3 bacterium]
MISVLHGRVISKNITSVVIDCAGIGFSVNVPFLVAQSLAIDSIVTILVQPIFSHDNFELYGFLKKEERDTFNLLLKVPGVGARAALNILSRLTPEEIHDAIGKGKTDVFKAISGIGKKKAEMIIFNLRKSVAETSTTPEVQNTVLTALMALGFSRKEALQKLSAIPDVNSKPIAEIIRLVLKSQTK